MDGKINSEIMIDKLKDNSYQSTRKYNDNKYVMLRNNQNDLSLKLQDELLNENLSAFNGNGNITHEITPSNDYPIRFLTYNQTKKYFSDPNVKMGWDVNISNKHLFTKYNQLKEPIKDIRINERAMEICNASTPDISLNNKLFYGQTSLRRGDGNIVYDQTKYNWYVDNNLKGSQSIQPNVGMMTR